MTDSTNRLQCIEPDFQKYINPVQIRRMSRMLKIGFSAAMNCIEKSNCGLPEAIIIGTGKGSMYDTELFLHAIKEYNETALNATNFIHSTYNQLNGMVALNKKINSYNNTFVHRGFSLEHALIDAMLLFSEGEINTALVGSYDEMTPEHFEIKNHWNFWKKEKITNLELFQHENTSGTIAGEGAGFFIVSCQKPITPCVTISQIETMYNPTEPDFEEKICSILHENNLTTKDIDIILMGKNGSSLQKGFFDLLEKEFKTAIPLQFKHLCGEYDTAVNFALWLAQSILQEQEIHPSLFINSSEKLKKNSFKNILIYNNYFEKNQSLILIELAV